MKKKRGFTLVELLAVICLISVITLIAVPVVMNILREIKASAFKSSVENTLKAIEFGKVDNKKLKANPSYITESNIKKEIGIDGSKYKNLELSKQDKKLYIYVEGIDDYDGLAACGTYGDVKISKDNDCIRIEKFDDTRIQELINQDYIPIADATELNNIRDNKDNTFGSGTKWEGTYRGGLDKKYVQVNDIDVSNEFKTFVPLGSRPYVNLGEEQPGDIFTGVYNGLGYIIDNLNINQTNPDIPVGLFSTSSGEITNVVIRNARVFKTKSTKVMPTGILVGRLIDNGTLSQIDIKGVVKSSGKRSQKIGGIIGIVDKFNTKELSNLYFDGYVQNEDGKAGGIIGSVENFNEFSIKDSTAKGYYYSEGENQTGGIIGIVMPDYLNLDEDGVEANALEGDTSPRREERSMSDMVFANKVTMDNCKFYGNITSSGIDRPGTAGLIGFVGFLNNIEVKNATVEANIESAGKKVAGIIGAMESTLNINFSNLTVNGNYKGSKHVGGVGGRYVHFDMFKIKDLNVNGNIYSANSMGGGVVGEIGGGIDYGLFLESGPKFDHVVRRDNALLFDNINIDVVIDGKNEVNRFDYISENERYGGISGHIKNIKNITIQNCDANILVDVFAKKVGGVIGELQSTEVATLKNMNINIINDNLATKAGGVVGSVQVAKPITIQDVIIRGRLNLSSNPKYRQLYSNHVGSIVGEMGTWNLSVSNLPIELNINNCISYVDIATKGNHIGGLFGGAHIRTTVPTVNISNSAYHGNITTENTIYFSNGNNFYQDHSYSYVGGLIGHTVYGSITNSYATGSIRNKIVNSDFRCSNSSDNGGNPVFTKHGSGGLVGLVEKSLTINNSYSAMDYKILNNDGSLYNGAGINAVGGSTDKITSTNVYYDSSLTSYTDTLGTGKTTNELKQGTLTGFDSSVWAFTNGEYPKLKIEE